VRHFLDTDCDAWVLETGMGGASDEVSLFAAGVVVVTPVFEEHLGILGGTVSEIVHEKLGLVSEATRTLVAVRQEHPEAAAVLRDVRGPALLMVGPPRVARAGGTACAAPVQPGLSGANAAAGVAAGRALLDSLGLSLAEDRLEAMLATVRLPGRLSQHRRGRQRWLVDAATNGRAAAEAVRIARHALGTVDTVLLCVPDGKDIDGVRRALHGLRQIPVRTDAPHLRFQRWDAALPALGDLDLDGLGEHVLALGTVHFVGDVMEALDVETSLALTPPAGLTPQAGSSAG